MGPLEELDRPFVLLGSVAGGERPEVSAFAGFGVGFSGIEAILPCFEFPDHVIDGAGIVP
jgi:hypothetical protein